jgi:hypothetical protein
MPEHNRPIQSYDEQRVLDLILACNTHGADSAEFMGQLTLAVTEYDCDVLIASLVIMTLVSLRNGLDVDEFIEAAEGVIQQHRDEEAESIGWSGI